MNIIIVYGWAMQKIILESDNEVNAKHCFNQKIMLEAEKVGIWCQKARGNVLSL